MGLSAATITTGYYRIYKKGIKTNNFYRRIGIVEIPGNEFVSLDWMDRCNRSKLSRCVWREIVCDPCYSRK